MKAGKRDRRITILQKVEGTADSELGTPTIVYLPFATVWAEVQDVLPSRGENIAEGINIARRPCRIRMLYMPGISSEMRVEYGDRTLRMITEPAEMGRREGLEFMAEELSSEGQEP